MDTRMHAMYGTSQLGFELLKDCVVGGCIHLILIKFFLHGGGSIHINQSSAGLVFLHVQNNIALKVKGDFSALIKFVLNIDEFNGVGQIFSFASKRDSPEFTLMSNRLES